MMIGNKYWAKRGMSLDSALLEGNQVNKGCHGKYEEKKGKKESSKNEPTRATLMFALKNEVDGLVKTLQIFQEKHISLVRIESRKSKRRDSEVEVLVDCSSAKEDFKELIQLLRAHAKIISLNLLTSNWIEEEEMSEIVWFPKKLSELDKSSQRVLMYGSELDADHPALDGKIFTTELHLRLDIQCAQVSGFPTIHYSIGKGTSGSAFFLRCAPDQGKQPRSVDIVSSAPSKSFVSNGQPIPRVEYTEEEIRTWGVVFRELTQLYPTHACQEYLKNFPLLIKYCGYREDNIPQLEDVSAFLKERSGFVLRPVAGYLSPRDFLAGLAFRVFHCTQYVRHGSDPFYTPEPDTCHELLGHVPLLAEPSFAEFSQELGLVSLAASDEDVQKLATCYFFTVEFGLCKQEGQLRAYGAGLLSSIGELKHALSDKAIVKAFDPKTTCTQECLITTFQEAYFLSESFEEAKEKMREFAKSVKRPFSIHYDPYTQSIEVLKDPRSIEKVVQGIRSDLTTVCDSLSKMNKGLGS